MAAYSLVLDIALLFARYIKIIFELLKLFRESKACRLLYALREVPHPNRAAFAKL